MRLLAFLVASVVPLAHAAPTRQFDWFFPGWNQYIQEILTDSCGVELGAYRAGEVNTTNGLSSLVTPVIDCILVEFPEFRKAELSASAVVLGSLPLVLQSLGSTTAETALIGLRRPGLALLLALGSPAVAVSKADELAETLGKFAVVGWEDVASFDPPCVDWSVVPPLVRPFISLAEYLLTGGAVANVVNMAYRLGVHAIVGFSPDTIFMVPLWTLLAVIIHVVGVLGLALRVKSVEAKSDRDDNDAWKLPSEFVPSAYQQPKRLVWRGGSVVFPAIAWLLSIGAVIHTIVGTLVLSSLLFFSITDSIIIAARYMASAVVCRAMARLELSGMQAAAKRTPSSEGHEGEVMLDLPSK